MLSMRQLLDGVALALTRVQDNIEGNGQFESSLSLIICVCADLPSSFCSTFIVFLEPGNQSDGSPIVYSAQSEGGAGRFLARLARGAPAVVGAAQQTRHPRCEIEP